MTLGGGYMLPSREGRQIAAIGLGITMKTDGKSTHDAYSLFEYSIPPRTDGPPAHIHTREDESFICLAGQLDVFLGGEDFTLGPGDHLYLPRDVVHTFRNTLRRGVPGHLGRLAGLWRGLLPGPGRHAARAPRTSARSRRSWPTSASSCSFRPR